jgi:RNA polymerase sigma-70 factor (ECF subfamily)
MTIAPLATTNRGIADPADRAALVRAFAAWTGDAATADDLAQETLLAAWTSSRQPERAEAWRPWLFGVARNILLRWRRDMAQHGRRVASAPESERHLLAAATSDDLEALLRREDIVDLLDAALGCLPQDTRRALLLKYIDDLPQAEIAARMGIHEKALEGRLHRGKRALHRHLIVERADSAVALGLIAEPDTWVETDIWCPVCGRRHLHGRWYENGDLRLDCLACEGWFRPGERSHFFSTKGGEQGVRSFAAGRRPSFRVAMERVSAAHHRAMADGLDSAWPCPSCGGTVRPRVAVSADDPEGAYGPEVRYDCDRCGFREGYSFVPGSGYLHPAIRAWNERHERIRMMLPRFVDLGGRPSIETVWESVTDSGAAVTIHDLASLKLVRATCDGTVALEREPA